MNLMKKLSDNIKNLKNKKAQAGMQLFTGIIVSIFMIGLIIMVFVLFGEKMIDNLDATDVSSIATINDTIQELADVPDWFGLFILMGAMIVIILMVVLIISAIKQANMGGGTVGG